MRGVTIVILGGLVSFILLYGGGEVSPAQRSGRGLKTKKTGLKYKTYKNMVHQYSRHQKKVAGTSTRRNRPGSQNETSDNSNMRGRYTLCTA